MAGYTQSRLIYLALRKIGVIQSGGTPTANQLADAQDTLDDMIQEWQADGLRLWVMDDITVPLVAGKKTYTIGPSGADVTAPRPERIIGGRRHDLTSGYDTPMVYYSRTDYNQLSNKDQTGQMVAFYYDKHLVGTVYVYLVPDATIAAQYTLILTVQKPLDSVTSSTTTMQFPNAWFQALKYGLAAALAPDYGVPVDQRQLLMQETQMYKANLENYDQEDPSTYFTIDYTYR